METNTTPAKGTVQWHAKHLVYKCLKKEVDDCEMELVGHASADGMEWVASAIPELIELAFASPDVAAVLLKLAANIRMIHLAQDAVEKSA